MPWLLTFPPLLTQLRLGASRRTPQRCCEWFGSRVTWGPVPPGGCELHLCVPSSSSPGAPAAQSAPRHSAPERTAPLQSGAAASTTRSPGSARPERGTAGRCRAVLRRQRCQRAQLALAPAYWAPGDPAAKRPRSGTEEAEPPLPRCRLGAGLADPLAAGPSRRHPARTRQRGGARSAAPLSGLRLLLPAWRWHVLPRPALASSRRALPAHRPEHPRGPPRCRQACAKAALAQADPERLEA